MEEQQQDVVDAVDPLDVPPIIPARHHGPVAEDEEELRRECGLLVVEELGRSITRRRRVKQSRRLLS